MNYVSSIVSKYGDVDRVKSDVETLNEILGRQGSSLLIDVIAESVGATSNRFKLSDSERQRLVESLVTELKESLLERT
jgi:hypothetical protein